MAAAHLGVSKLEVLRRRDQDGDPGVDPDETMSLAPRV